MVTDINIKYFNFFFERYLYYYSLLIIKHCCFKHNNSVVHTHPTLNPDSNIEICKLFHVNTNNSTFLKGTLFTTVGGRGTEFLPPPPPPSLPWVCVKSAPNKINILNNRCCIK